MKFVKTFRANNISDLDESEIRENEYLHESTEFNDAGLAIEAITYNPDGSVESVFKYQYNDAGLLEHELLFENDGEITQHRSLEYNAAGQVIKESVHYLDGTADDLLYTYDEKGRLVSRRSIDSDGETGNYLVNVYDGDHLVSESEYDISGEIITQRRIVYNDEGKMTEEIFVTPEENYHIVYNYDENGIASVRRRYNDEKHLMERNTFSYDSEGRLSESMEETSAGIEMSYTSYDEAGNIILQEEQTENGDLLSRIERTWDQAKRPLTTVVLSQRPGQMAPVHYRIRVQYE